MQSPKLCFTAWCLNECDIHTHSWTGYVDTVSGARSNVAALVAKATLTLGGVSAQQTSKATLERVWAIYVNHRDRAAPCMQNGNIVV